MKRFSVWLLCRQGGWVVCEEDKEMLLAAWEEDVIEQRKKELEVWWCCRLSWFSLTFHRCLAIRVGTLRQCLTRFAIRIDITLAFWRCRFGIGIGVTLAFWRSRFAIGIGVTLAYLCSRFAISGVYCMTHDVINVKQLLIASAGWANSISRFWNTLPVSVTSAPSLAVFRSRLKSYLFEQSFPQTVTDTYLQCLHRTVV